MGEGPLNWHEAPSSNQLKSVGPPITLKCIVKSVVLSGKDTPPGRLDEASAVSTPGLLIVTEMPGNIELPVNVS